MGKTRYQRAKEFLEELRKNHGSIINFEVFRNQAMLCLGADEERTVRPYFKLMSEANLIMEKGEQVVIL